MSFNLFHRFASSELTHSGIWAWILQSLDDDAPCELHELRPAARALLDRMNVGEFRSPIRVSRERRLKGKAGRVDIEAVDRTGRIVVIETKVSAIPDVSQRQRYKAAYRDDGVALAGIAILSTTFDEPWNVVGADHIGAADLLEVLRAGPYEQGVMNQYVAWLEHLLQTRRDLVAAALGDSPTECSSALQTAAAQWGVMRDLGNALGGPGAARLFAGQNRNGSPWTQLLFSPGGSPAFDALFYRLESLQGGPAQFTLRQYQRPADAGKTDRLRVLRQMFRDAVAGCPVSFDTEPRHARMRAEEAKVFQVLMKDTTMSTVLIHLPSAHRQFVAKLRTLGWPMGPGGITVPQAAEADA